MGVYRANLVVLVLNAYPMKINVLFKSDMIGLMKLNSQSTELLNDFLYMIILNCEES
jgi:hypothetical protein